MKKNLKIALYVIGLLLACIIAVATYFMITGGESKKEYSANGVTVTLPSSFKTKDVAEFTSYFENDEVTVTALEEQYQFLELVDLGKDSTIEKYVEAVAKNNNTTYELKDITGTEYKYYTYEKETENKTLYYVDVVLKGKNGFWLVKFSCDGNNKDKYNGKFINWAKTIKVD